MHRLVVFSHPIRPWIRVRGREMYVNQRKEYSNIAFKCKTLIIFELVSM